MTDLKRKLFTVLYRAVSCYWPTARNKYHYRSVLWGKSEMLTLNMVDSITSVCACSQKKNLCGASFDSFSAVKKKQKNNNKKKRGANRSPDDQLVTMMINNKSKNNLVMAPQQASLFI